MQDRLPAVRKVGAALGALTLLAVPSFAQITLPDLGVDVPGHATAMGTDLGAIFVAILGISAVFIAGSIGWRWLRRAKG